MPIPWIIGGIIVAGVAAAIASDDDDSSSSSSRDSELERERERARHDNERKKQKAKKQAKKQRIASENKATAQRFIAKHKLSLAPEEVINANVQNNQPSSLIIAHGINANGQDSQLSLLIMNAYNSKASVCRRDSEIEVLEQELDALGRLEEESSWLR